MRLNYHNKIEILSSKNKYVFYNTMLDSVYEKIANFQSFFDKIVIGNGKSSNIYSNYKLEKLISCSELELNSIKIISHGNYKINYL